MTKSEIIEAVSLATVPQGATLVETDMPSGVTVSEVGPGQTASMRIIMARLFRDQLAAYVADEPDIRCPRLFQRIHEAVIEIHQQQIEDLDFEAAQEEVIADHKAVVARLQSIAVEHKVEYEVPPDPLMA